MAISRRMGVAPALLLASLSLLCINASYVDLPPAVAEINEKDFEGQSSPILSGTWVLEFYTPSCLACQTYEEQFLAIAKSPEASKLRFAKIDLEKSPIAVASYNILQTPTLVVFKDGRYKGQIPTYTEALELVQAVGIFTEASMGNFSSLAAMELWKEEPAAPRVIPTGGCNTCRTNLYPEIPVARYVLLDRTPQKAATETFAKMAHRMFKKGSVEFSVVESPLLEELSHVEMNNVLDIVRNFEAKNVRVPVKEGEAVVVALHHDKPVRLPWVFSMGTLRKFVTTEKFAPMGEYYPENHGQYLELIEANRPIAMAILDPQDGPQMLHKAPFASTIATDPDLTKGLTAVWVDYTQAHKRFFMMLGLTQSDMPHCAVIQDGKMALCGPLKDKQGVEDKLHEIVSGRVQLKDMSLPSMSEFEKWEKSTWAAMPWDREL